MQKLILVRRYVFVIIIYRFVVKLVPRVLFPLGSVNLNTKLRKILSRLNLILWLLDDLN
jgi:hypothetical protein